MKCQIRYEDFSAMVIEALDQRENRSKKVTGLQDVPPGLINRLQRAQISAQAVELDVLQYLINTGQATPEQEEWYRVLKDEIGGSGKR